MRRFLCCMLVLGALFAKVNPIPVVPAPAPLDTPDDQDVAGAAAPGAGAGAGGVAAAGATGADANPQVSSYYLPADSSSSSSSSEEYDSGLDLPDGGGGSVPAGTNSPSGAPVAGAGVAAGAAAAGSKPVQGGAAGQGGAGVSDQNSGEVPGGSMLVAGNPAKLSEIQAKPNGLHRKTGSGKSAGIAIGVLGLISVATVAIIFTIRKRRDGFMRFYSQANAEL